VTVQLGGHPALRDLDLAVRRGDVLVLLGRSGSGKTTTLKLINGLRRPTAGTVTVEGRATDAWPAHELRRRVGYVIQDVGLFPHFDVARNAGIVLELLGWGPERRRPRVNELLALVGLDPARFAARLPRELSGGERQRVGIARALAAGPPLLLMDEPFGALDPLTRAELTDEFAALVRRLATTVVFVTHDVREALRVGSRIVLLEGGAGVFDGTPDEFRRAEHPAARAFARVLAT
jgi:osmoprotectant transport system ATP-binding protein